MTHQRNIPGGLGYVGLPVAVAFGLHGKTIDFDINKSSLAELRKGVDNTNETEARQLSKANIEFCDDIQRLSSADFHIVALPTPLDDAHQPDLTPLKKSSDALGTALKRGDIAVYESIVYLGVTEDYCASADA